MIAPGLLIDLESPLTSKIRQTAQRQTQKYNTHLYSATKPLFASCSTLAASIAASLSLLALLSACVRGECVLQQVHIQWVGESFSAAPHTHSDTDNHID